MPVIKLLSLLIASAVIAGCASPVPVAQNFPRSYQKVARTAHHWDVVAGDVAAQTTKMIAESKALQERDLYVPVGPRNSFFDATFREFLIDHLVNKGMPVIACPADDGASGFQQAPVLSVQYDTKVMRHAEMPNYQPGTMTALAAGIYALRGIATLDAVDARAVGAIASVGAVDAWIAQMPDETRTELIVTATIMEGNRFVMRRSLIYYVPDGDWALFASRSDKRSSCSKGKAAAAIEPGTQATGNSRDTELARLRMEKVEREMIRFNENYRPQKTASSAVFFE